MALYKMCVGLYPFERLQDSADARTAVQVSDTRQTAALGAGVGGWPVRVGGSLMSMCAGMPTARHRTAQHSARRWSTHRPADLSPSASLPSHRTSFLSPAPCRTCCPASLVLSTKSQTPCRLSCGTCWGECTRRVAIALVLLACVYVCVLLGCKRHTTSSELRICWAEA